MSHRSLATWLLLLSLGIVGVQACGSGEDAATTEEDPATTEEVAENGESVPVEPFSTEPTAPETEPRTTAAPAGLINSTNSDERAQEVQSRINNTADNTAQDPFDVLPVELLETLETPEEGEAVAASPQTTGEDGQTAISLPPLPPTVAQIAQPLPDLSEIDIPRNESVVAQSQPGGITISEPSGPSGPSGLSGPSSPSGPSGPSGPSTSSSPGAPSLPPLDSQPIASTPPLPNNIGPTVPEEAPFSLPPLDSQPLAELPPLPNNIGPTVPEEAPFSLPPLDSQPLAELPPLPTEIGPAIPPPPPVPPTISENVQVTGVVEVGGEVQVIVQLPGSSSGRYVRVGDVIAGGRVLVKRVDGIQSTNPIVILEEDGSEYPRFLGEPPTIAMEEDSGLG